MRSNGCLVMTRKGETVHWYIHCKLERVQVHGRPPPVGSETPPSDATPPGAVDSGGHPDQRLTFYLVKGIKEGF